MIDSFYSRPDTAPSGEPIPIFAQKALDRCHIVVSDNSKPMGAVMYEGQFYSYVKFFRDAESARRGGQRLEKKGNKVILTRVQKGLVLWVLEPDAQRIAKSTR